jgi:hypothetical protein
MRQTFSLHVKEKNKEEYPIGSKKIFLFLHKYSGYLKLKRVSRLCSPPHFKGLCRPFPIIISCIQLAAFISVAD